MAALIDEIWAKFNRAEEHKSAYEALIAEWMATQPYGFAGEEEEDGWYVVRLQEHTKPPLTRLSLLYADYTHNLRATLDHLVWHLVEHLSPGSASDQTAFPVVWNRRDWKGQRNNRLKGFPREHVPVIEDAQPFNVPEAERRHHWLHFLHRLDIRQKHHLLVGLTITRMDWHPRFIFNRDLVATDHVEEVRGEQGPFEEGEELVRLRPRSISNDLRIIEMSHRGNASFRIGSYIDLFEGADQQVPDMSAGVRGVIEALQPALLADR